MEINKQTKQLWNFKPISGNARCRAREEPWTNFVSNTFALVLYYWVSIENAIMTWICVLSGRDRVSGLLTLIYFCYRYASLIWSKGEYNKVTESEHKCRKKTKFTCYWHLFANVPFFSKCPRAMSRTFEFIFYILNRSRLISYAVE